MSLVIRETCRIHAIKDVLKEFSGKVPRILDVGCGDGSWWRVLSQDQNYSVDGIDISESEVEKAAKIINAKKIDITNQLEIKNLRGEYELAIGNCSLEHIPNIDEALKNIHGLLLPGASFVLFVPTPDWALKGETVSVMNKISPRLSMMFSGMMNGFFQHWHLYHYRLWKHILSSNGFDVREVRGLGSARLEFLFRLYLPTSFISFLVKKLTGKYLNYFISPFLPAKFYQTLAAGLSPSIESSLTGPDDPDAFEYMITARRI